jgi:predicted CoA-binding protein
MGTLQEQIKLFLNGSPFAVAGASTNRSKYGNKVLRCYLQNGREAIPVHPHEPLIEGLTAYPTLEAIGRSVHGISIITPPPVTYRIVQSAIVLGIKNMWMQPGAESSDAVEEAKSAGVNVISGGPCILVVLGYRER